LVAGNTGDQFGTQASGTFSQWWWWAGDPQEPARSNSFQFDDHLLSIISLELNGDVTVEELIAVYGSPMFLMVDIEGPHGFIPRDPVGVAVTALYYENRMAVTWFERTDVSTDPVEYCPDVATLLDTAEYYDQGLADYYLNQFDEIRLSARPGGVVLPGDWLMWPGANVVETACAEIPQ
jgi:hypothetical protein